MAFLELKDITRKYKLGQVQVTALGGVSLSIEEGEYVSIMGPSGSGKSTLLNIIGCLDLPSSGTYLFDGKHIESLKDGELADLRNRRIGFVFQQFHLLPNLTGYLKFAGNYPIARVKLQYKARPDVIDPMVMAEQYSKPIRGSAGIFAGA